MKLRKEDVANPEPGDTREEVREMAEALSLYRSAMHHLAEREVARPFAADWRPSRRHSFRLVLAPALTAAVAAAVLVPVYTHVHDHGTGTDTGKVVASDTKTPAAPSVDDTVLMNQIDSEVSEDVPDALRPLADLSDPTTTSNTASEKKNATQE
jgi:hypothetical protein